MSRQNQEYTDVMIDLETMGVGDNSPVLAMGAIEFDRYYVNPINVPRVVSTSGEVSYNGYKSVFSREVSLLDNLVIGRVIEPGTAKFWAQQTDRTIIEKSMSSSVSVASAMSAFTDYLNSLGKAYVWAKSPTFDITILRSLSDKVNIKLPIPYYNERDVRTAMDAAKLDVKKLDINVTYDQVPIGLHHPIYDCVVQIEVVQRFFALLKQEEGDA